MVRVQRGVFEMKKAFELDIKGFKNIFEFVAILDIAEIHLYN
jgi:hypothetical protein